MKKLLALAICLAMVIGLTACTAAPAPAAEATEAPAAEATEAPAAAEPEAPAAGIAKEDLKIGIILIGDSSDMGYNYAHAHGLEVTKQNLGLSDDQIIMKENIPEDSACADAINELIEAGCQLIFANSFGFGTYMAEAAEAHPEVFFAHATGPINNGTNMCNYFGRIYQPRYLAGIAAGLKTQSKKIGYVGAFSNAEVNQGLNAFTLGVQSVCPDAQVFVKYTNSWYDPTTEAAAANALLDMGCDIIAQHVDTTGPQVAAEARGAWGCGYNADMTEAAPNAHLCAPIWNWGGVMTKITQSVIDGTFEGKLTYGDMIDGTCDLSPLTANCAEGTQAKVDEVKQKFLDKTWDVFQDGVTLASGEQVAGSTFTDDFIYSGMDSEAWLVKGITVS